MRWLVVILVIAFFARLYHFAYPLGDLHSWRQADTAAVSRSLYAYGQSFWLPVCQQELPHIGSQGQECRIPLLNPQFDSYVTIDGKATWMDGRPHTNDTRNHFAEFPVYQAIVAQMALVFDVVPFFRSMLVTLSFWVEASFMYVDKGRAFLEPKEFQYFISNFNGMVQDNIILAGRFVTMISSLISIWAVYRLTLFYYKKEVALLSALVFGLLPYTVFWSRTVLPDPMMLMWVLVGSVFFHKWLFGQKRIDLLMFSLCFLLALLMKVFVLFFAIPLLYLLYLRFGFRFIARRGLWVALSIVIIPFLLWRWWIQTDVLRLPGIPASAWLFNGSGVRLKPAWWYWLFQTRLDHFMFNFPGLMFGGVGLFMFRVVSVHFKRGAQSVFAALAHAVSRDKNGLDSSLEGSDTQNTATSADVVSRDKNGFGPYDESGERLGQLMPYFWIGCLISCFLYLVVFATGNVQHEYYQLPLVPFVSVFVALGFLYLWQVNRGFGGLVQKAGLLGLFGLIWLFGAYKVMNWYGTQNPSFVYAASRANLLLPQEATVIADFGGDTTMLYYVNRPGWSIMEFSTEELIRRGATHYISAYRTEGVNELAKKYTVIEETPEYLILDLTKPL